MLHKFWFLGIGTLLLLITSCGNSEPHKLALPQEADSFIAADSAKTWMLASRYNGGHRMNMGDCFLRYRITYHRDSTFADNNGSSSSCGPSLHGKWKAFQNEHGSFIKWESPQLPSLMQIENDYKYFRLITLNADSLVVSYKHTQYGNQERTIVDYYVPEGTKVADRDFHNR